MDVSTGKVYEPRPGETVDEMTERLGLDRSNMAEIYAEKQAVERLSSAVQHMNRAERRAAARGKGV